MAFEQRTSGRALGLRLPDVDVVLYSLRNPQATV
jgi:hypothetical protein